MTHAQMTVPVHTLDSAPAASREALERIQTSLGFVPNLMGVLANAPALLEGYRALSDSFDRTSFTPTERQVVLLAVSHANRCDYCMAAHTVLARMRGVDAGVLGALRSGEPIAEPKLEALRQFTASLVHSGGRPTANALERFTAAGFGATQMLEVVLGVGLKTLSNYANHLAGTPLDAQFQAAAWKPTACECGA